jgi:hypothetical protein
MGIIFLLGIVPRVLANWGCSTDQIRLAEIVSFWGHVDRLSRGVIEPRVIAGHLTMCAGFVWGTSRIARRMDEAGEPGA